MDGLWLGCVTAQPNRNNLQSHPYQSQHGWFLNSKQIECAVLLDSGNLNQQNLGLRVE